MTTSKTSKTSTRRSTKQPKLELVKDEPAQEQPEQPEQQDQPAPKPKQSRKKQPKPDQPTPFNPTISMTWEGEDKPEWTGALDALCRLNEFDPEQDREFLDEMRAELKQHGEYKGGGGAAPVYVLNVVEGDAQPEQPAADADAQQSVADEQPAAKPKRTRKPRKDADPSVPVADSAAVAEEPSQETTAPDEPAQAPKRGRGSKRKPSAITLADLADRYLASLVADQRSDATVGAYKSDLAIAQRVLGAETAIDAITPQDVARFNASDDVLLARSGAEKAKPTIDRTRRVLRLALDYAEAEGWIVTTPCVEPGEEPQA